MKLAKLRDVQLICPHPLSRRRGALEVLFPLHRERARVRAVFADVLGKSHIALNYQVIHKNSWFKHPSPVTLHLKTVSQYF